MHASQEQKRRPHTSDSLLTLFEKKLQKKMDISIPLGKISNFKKQIIQNRVREVKL
jgi:hypothetical protein